MHKLKLSNGAARWLALYLSIPETLNTTPDVYNAGAIIHEHLEDAMSLPKEKQQGEEWEKWAVIERSEFEITEAARESVKRGLQSLAKRGLLQTSKHTMELLTLFGLTA